MFESGGKETQVSVEERPIVSRSPEETRDIGYRLGRRLQPGSVVLLTGPIGAGKSVLARGIAEALGVDRWRGSPTFTIVHEYETETPLYHLDLYRLTERESEELGLEEYLRPDSIAVIEWADRALDYLQELAGRDAVRLDLAVLDREQRLISVHGADSIDLAPRVRPQQMR
jgi:tRNA threonylcarbamoyladenosine biosynthesis protein TsaE